MEDDGDAQALWDYMLMGHVLERADVIMVLGSNDLRVAEHAADLYKRGLAPLLLFSGNVGVLTKELFGGRTEADVFADVALQCGVPENALLRERESTNTGENVRLSHKASPFNLLSAAPPDTLHRQLLCARGGAPVRRIILVQKPFMERRSYATFVKQWPGNMADLDVRVSSPPIAFRDYPNAVLTREGVISVMCGDLQREFDYVCASLLRVCRNVACAHRVSVALWCLRPCCLIRPQYTLLSRKGVPDCHGHSAGRVAGLGATGGARLRQPSDAQNVERRCILRSDFHVFRDERIEARKFHAAARVRLLVAPALIALPQPANDETAEEHHQCEGQRANDDACARQ